jgi:hypothetical protein
MEAFATLDDLSKFVRSGVEEIGRKFTDPEDDWTAVMFVQTPSGVDILGLPSCLFESGAVKDALANILRSFVATAGAYRYALLLNTHMTVGNPDVGDIQRVRQGEVRIEQLPGAIEALLLIVGDAETELGWMAEIKRTPHMLRTITEWKKLTPDGLEGRFAGLSEALRHHQPPPPSEEE